MPGKKDAGLTLIEVMAAIVLIGVAITAILSAIPKIQRSLQKSKTRSLAVELCRDLVETLKSRPYTLLRPTTQLDLDTYGYDATYWPPTLGLSAGRLSFDRFNRVSKVLVDPSGTMLPLPPGGPDAGLKKIEVWVEWNEEGQRRRYSMSTLYVDPNRTRPAGTISGTVYKAPGTALEGAQVIIEENPSRLDITSASGAYAVQTASGTFTLRASKRGYFPASASVTANPDATQDFTLAPRGTGTISGYAYLRDHLVISQVVASSVQANGYDAQYVELYNPTTAPIFIGDSLSHSVRLRYASPYQTQDCPDIALTYISTFAAASSYYLVANTTTFVVAGATTAADAYFTDAGAASCAAIPTGWSPPASRRILQPGQAGSVVLADASGAKLDAVGWKAGATAPAFCEGGCLPLASALSAGDQLVRLSSPTAAPGGAAGRAYDANDNAGDFAAPPAFPGLTVAPLNSASGPRAAATGTPASGGVVSADDDVSSPVVIVSSSGRFDLPAVATCTITGSTAAWTVSVSSRDYWAFAAGFVPPQGGSVSAGAVVLTSAPANASVVTGVVLDIGGSPLTGILVFCEGFTTTTDGTGRYRLVISSGTGLIATANAGHAVTGYSAEVSATFDALAGATVNGINFTLTPVGTVSGAVTTDGVNALPGAVVRAEAPPGTMRGFATSDSAGNFTIQDVPTSSIAGVGPYAVSVSVDPTQSCSPVSAAATVIQAANVSVGTFTVSGALGTIQGAVSENGQPIGTGVLIVATQDTLAALPPDWTETLRGGATMYYSVYSGADGTYSLPVRVSTAAYNVYAWYSKLVNGSAVTTQKAATQTVNSPSTPSTVTFTWP